MKTLEKLRKQAEDELIGQIITGGNPAESPARVSFRSGWDAAVKELTMWRNPEEELPDNSMRVIVCVQLPNRAKLITGGWHGTSPEEAGWHTDIDWKDMDVVGWRPIHELPVG